MSLRLDVRRMLLRRGWTEESGEVGLLRKNGSVWAATNYGGDSSVSGPSSRGGLWTVGFDNSVPARVIVATCEAGAQDASAKPLQRTDPTPA